MYKILCFHFPYSYMFRLNSCKEHKIALSNKRYILFGRFNPISFLNVFYISQKDFFSGFLNITAIGTFG